MDIDLEKMADEINDLCFKAQNLYDKYISECKDKALFYTTHKIEKIYRHQGFIFLTPLKGESRAVGT